MAYARMTAPYINCRQFERPPILSMAEHHLVPTYHISFITLHFHYKSTPLYIPSMNPHVCTVQIIL